MKRTMIVSALVGGMLLGGCSMMSSDPAMPMDDMSAKTTMPMPMKPMAGMSHYHATLAPAAGVTSSGSGMGMAMYEPATHTLTYEITFQGLTGPAVAGHIHGPADAGGSAPPVVPFATTESPIKGTATLTDAQAADLAAGKYYVNIHTAANKGGEIRGQFGAM